MKFLPALLLALLCLSLSGRAAAQPAADTGCAHHGAAQATALLRHAAGRHCPCAMHCGCEHHCAASAGAAPASASAPIRLPQAATASALRPSGAASMAQATAPFRPPIAAPPGAA